MAGFETTGRWYGPPERPLLGWWTDPLPPRGGSGVVIASPVGYEYWSAHRTLRVLAEQLALRGHAVMRFDYDGTGDSAGDRWEPGRVAAWRSSLAAAVAAMRARGIDRVTLVGLRLGATLALLDGAALGADAVVAWAPVLSGKRFAKEVRLLGLAVPERDGAVVYAGTVISPETAGDLGRIQAEKVDARPAHRVLLVLRPEQPADALAGRLRDLGAEVEMRVLPGAETALDVPSEDATVPTTIVESIAAWVGDAAADGRRAALEPAGRPTAEIPWGEGRVVEEVVRIGSLVGIRTDPSSGPSATLVTFLNSGSETHIGPGRAWVDYSRALALRGFTTMRLDFTGWGESPDGAHAPGRPYDAHCVDETVRFVHAAGAMHQRVVLAGLCAGAWIALRAAQITEVSGVIAINPQLYWEPGDPVEALLSDTRRRRTKIRERDALVARYKGWTALDLLGIRPMASRWLSALRRRKTPVLMLFAEGDDGLEYLRTRCSRRLSHEIRAGYLQVEEVPGLDHQMYREWLRGDVAERLTRFLSRTAPAHSRDGLKPLAVRANEMPARHGDAAGVR